MTKLPRLPPLCGGMLKTALTQLFYVNGQMHRGMDVALHIEGPGDRKRHVDGLAWRLFVGIDVEGRRIDIGLVQEGIVVDEGDRIALGDVDRREHERAAILIDPVDRRGPGGKRYSGPRHQEEPNQEGASEGRHRTAVCQGVAPLSIAAVANRAI